MRARTPFSFGQDDYLEGGGLPLPHPSVMSSISPDNKSPCHIDGNVCITPNCANYGTSMFDVENGEKIYPAGDEFQSVFSRGERNDSIQKAAIVPSCAGKLRRLKTSLYEVVESVKDKVISFSRLAYPFSDAEDGKKKSIALRARELDQHMKCKECHTANQRVLSNSGLASVCDLYAADVLPAAFCVNHECKDCFVSLLGRMANHVSIKPKWRAKAPVGVCGICEKEIYLGEGLPAMTKASSSRKKVRVSEALFDDVLQGGVGRVKKSARKSHDGEDTSTEKGIEAMIHKPRRLEAIDTRTVHRLNKKFASFSRNWMRSINAQIMAGKFDVLRAAAYDLLHYMEKQLSGKGLVVYKGDVMPRDEAVEKGYKHKSQQNKDENRRLNVEALMRMLSEGRRSETCILEDSQDEKTRNLIRHQAMLAFLVEFYALCYNLAREEGKRPRVWIETDIIEINVKTPGRTGKFQKINLMVSVMRPSYMILLATLNVDHRISSEEAMAAAKAAINDRGEREGLAHLVMLSDYNPPTKSSGGKSGGTNATNFGDACLVKDVYHCHGHFHVLSQITTKFRNIVHVMDGADNLAEACLWGFSDEIRDGKCHVAICTHHKPDKNSDADPSEDEDNGDDLMGSDPCGSCLNQPADEDGNSSGDKLDDETGGKAKVLVCEDSKDENPSNDLVKRYRDRSARKSDSIREQVIAIREIKKDPSKPWSRKDIPHIYHPSFTRRGYSDGGRCYKKKVITVRDGVDTENIVEILRFGGMNAVDGTCRQIRARVRGCQRPAETAKKGLNYNESYELPGVLRGAIQMFLAVRNLDAEHTQNKKYVSPCHKLGLQAITRLPEASRATEHPLTNFSLADMLAIPPAAVMRATLDIADAAFLARKLKFENSRVNKVNNCLQRSLPFPDKGKADRRGNSAISSPRAGFSQIKISDISDSQLLPYRLPHLWQSVPESLLPILTEIVLLEWITEDAGAISHYTGGEHADSSLKCFQNLYEKSRRLTIEYLRQNDAGKDEKSRVGLLDNFRAMMNVIRQNSVQQPANEDLETKTPPLPVALRGCLDVAAYLRGEKPDFVKLLRDFLLADPAALLLVMFLGDVRASLGRCGVAISGYELVLLYDDPGMRQIAECDGKKGVCPEIANLIADSSVSPVLKVAKLRELVGREVRKMASAKAEASGRLTLRPNFTTTDLTPAHLGVENAVLKEIIDESARKKDKKPDPNRMPLRKYMNFIELLVNLGICTCSRMSRKAHSLIGLSCEMLENSAVYSNLDKCLDADQRRAAASRVISKLEFPPSRDNLAVGFLALAEPGKKFRSTPMRRRCPIFMSKYAGDAMYESRKGIFPEILIDGLIRMFGDSVYARGNMILVGRGRKKGAVPGFHPATNGYVDAEALYCNADGEEWRLFGEISESHRYESAYTGEFLPKIANRARANRISGQKTFVLAASYGIFVPRNTPFKKMFPRVGGTSPELSLVDLANDEEDVTILPITFQTLGLMLQFSGHYNSVENRHVNILAESTADVVYAFLSGVEKDVARTKSKHLRTPGWDTHMKALFLHHFGIFRDFQLAKEAKSRSDEARKSRGGKP